MLFTILNQANKIMDTKFCVSVREVHRILMGIIIQLHIIEQNMLCKLLKKGIESSFSSNPIKLTRANFIFHLEIMFILK